MVTNKVFRFTFNEGIVNEMKEFSRIHKFDDRHDFKDAWKRWLTEHKTMISEEYERLHELGFNGDIEDKMFKSVRYYYRKKSNKKTEPKTRRKYVSLGKDMLTLIDTHIERNLVNDINYKPSNGFNEFVSIYDDEMNQVYETLSKHELSKNDIFGKIKKTYKNRYFIKKNKD